jgi:hypothetical protein
MKILADRVVFSADKVSNKEVIEIDSVFAKVDSLTFEKATIYPALINSHDHLVGNWYPRAVSNSKYPNSHDWVEDMKQHPTYLDRNKFWINDGSFSFAGKKELTLCNLGMYKNLLSGCTVVQDHAPKQKTDYYKQFPINVVEEYQQCHSLPLGNWWGGESAEEEFAKADGKVPFITHLGEGTDHITAGEFQDLLERNLLGSNTLLIHGIAFTPKDLEDIKKAGATVCWCPISNENLIGKTLDIDACLRLGTNVVIGTDSSLSGGYNLFDEIVYVAKNFSHIAAKDIFRMITRNARYALKLPEHYGEINSPESDILITDTIDQDPFKNVTQLTSENIQLLIHSGKPVYGDREYFQSYNLDESEYSFLKVGEREKFIIGNPQQLVEYVDSFLGYKKNFPYLPF